MLDTNFFFDTVDCNNAEEVANFIANMALNQHQKGYKTLLVYLDNYRGHLTKMRTTLSYLLEYNNIPVSCVIKYFPPYSPQLNVTEYIIHWIRQKYLHHHCHKVNIKDLKVLLKEKLKNKAIWSLQMIHNTLDHIFKNTSCQ